MFVKWAIKKSRVSTVYSGYRAAHKTAMNARRGDLLVAQLVESKRINGKPRQKVVAYLGSIRLLRIKDPNDQLTFWRHAQAAFKNAGLTNEQKRQIDSLLQKRVGKPSEEAIADMNYLRDHKDELDRMPKEIRMSRTTHQLAEIIRTINKGQPVKIRIPTGDGMEKVYTLTPPSRAEHEFMNQISDWKNMFPMALRDASGERREELLTLYKNLVGEEYKE